MTIWVVVGALVVGGVVGAVLYATRAQHASGGEEQANALAKAFNNVGGVTIRVSGGGKIGTATTYFDSSGSYETIVRGTQGGLDDGTLLSVGTDEYVNASQRALEHTFTAGSATLPTAKATLYSHLYNNKWINMVGAPLLGVFSPAHTSAKDFITATGGSWGSLFVTKGATLLLHAGKGTWTIDPRTSLPTRYVLSGAHGVVTMTFSYLRHDTLQAPAHSVTPPLPVNASLSPGPYPEGFSPIVLIYGEAGN